MTDVLSLYVLGFFTLTIALLFASYLSWLPRCIIRHAGSPEAIQSLLDPVGTTLSTSLRSRALANRRLALAFNLTNTFVSPDRDVHSAFLRRVQDILRVQARSGWNRFLEVSLQALDCTLGDCAPGDYSVFVQAVSLRVVIAGLLDVDRDVVDLDVGDVCEVCRLITELWSLSKTVDAMNSSVVSVHPDKLGRLNEHLRRLLPDTEAYPNPIDFVIPTWETLWRVVAICFAHVCREEKYKAPFRELKRKPDPRQFNDAVAGVSARYVVMECLRLYPPTRHISRLEIQRHVWVVRFLPAWAARMFERVKVDVADVESVHRDVGVWGVNARGFDPSRHVVTPSSSSSSSESVEKSSHTAFFAFGCGPLQCTGKVWAPMAIGLIVAAMVDKMDAGEMVVSAGDHVGGRAGWDRWFVEGERKAE